MDTTALVPTAPASTNPAAVYLARLAPGAHRAMADALGNLAVLAQARDPAGMPREERLALAASTPWWQMRAEHTQALRAQLAARFSPASTNKHLAALRGVLKDCWRLGLMEADVFARASDVKGVTGSRLPRGRMLTVKELARLFGACADGTASGARDAALLALCVGAGLRREEAVELDRASYDGAALRLVGKGNKERMVPVTNGTKAALDAWLQARGDAPGALLCPVSKAGVVDVRHMTAQAGYNALKRRGDDAGVASFSPHDLRRTFVSRLLDAGADLVAVQQLAGHASPMTTARYDRRGEDAKRRAVEMVAVPY